MAINKEIDKVSVPFQGFSFINGRKAVENAKEVSVSVPFRGFSFINGVIYAILEIRRLFPSPFGVFLL